MTMKDIGPQPQLFDIESATRKNINYRSVAWSGRYLHVTLMPIPVDGDIGLEMHAETDQFIRLDAGRGLVQMGASKTQLTVHREVSNGWCVWYPPVLGTILPIPGLSRCRCIPSMRPHIMRLEEYKRRRPMPLPTRAMHPPNCRFSPPLSLPTSTAKCLTGAVFLAV